MKNAHLGTRSLFASSIAAFPLALTMLLTPMQNTAASVFSRPVPLTRCIFIFFLSHTREHETLTSHTPSKYCLRTTTFPQCLQGLWHQYLDYYVDQNCLGEHHSSLPLGPPRHQGEHHSSRASWVL